jgi:hypothetical protein
VSSQGVIGPFFFEDNEGKADSSQIRAYDGNIFSKPINTVSQCHMVSAGWCHCTHTARFSKNTLKQLFPNRLISMRGDLTWPARSPDLSVCDVFLWGYLKSLVYADCPQNIETLKANIHLAISNIPEDMLSRCMQDVQQRCEECLCKNGGHLSDIIFRK